MNTNIQYWDSFLTPEEALILYKLDEYPWEFSGSSNGTAKSVGDYSRIFWYKDLSTFKDLEVLLKTKMETYLNKDIKSLNLYSNGQAHGQCGTLHADFFQPENITPNDGDHFSLVIYIHKNWLPIYGGHIIFTDVEQKNVIASIFPKSNSAVLFNSTVPHAALEPTVYCKEQRVSIAYKFKVLR
jgi:hypothetical protein